MRACHVGVRLACRCEALYFVPSYSPGVRRMSACFGRILSGLALLGDRILLYAQLSAMPSRVIAKLAAVSVFCDFISMLCSGVPWRPGASRVVALPACSDARGRRRPRRPAPPVRCHRGLQSSSRSLVLGKGPTCSFRLVRLSRLRHRYVGRALSPALSSGPRFHARESFVASHRNATYLPCHGILDGITGTWMRSSRDADGRLSRPSGNPARA